MAVSLLFWQRITAFGDVVVTLPAAALIALWLIHAHAWRLAGRWLLLFGGVMALVVVSKLAFIGWGIGSVALNFTGFSGHAMRAMAVLPVLGYLSAGRSSARGRALATAIGTVLGLAISLSRVIVHDHSASEAFTGALLGCAVAWLFLRSAQPLEPPAITSGLLAAVFAGLALMSAGGPAPTQQMLTEIALRLSGHTRAFARADWPTAKATPLPVQ